MRHPVRLLACLAAAAALATPASAHRLWMLPSATVLSGGDQWVTVDAAVSNDLFYFEHQPLRLDGLVATGPDGEPVPVENQARGRYRSTFDVHLTKPGTYRFGVSTTALFGSYRVGGEQKRFRAMNGQAPAIPEDATDVRLTQAQTKLETFVTSGKPSDAVLKTTGKGLELVPATHPNSLVSDEEARFALVLDGQPAANVEVEIVPGGNRYRQKLGDMSVKTGPDGTFAVKWPAAGMYWLSAEVTDDKATVPNARRRATYTTTLEVLPP